MRRKVLTHGLVASLAFLAGAAMVASVGPAGASSYRSLEVFAKVLAYVENSYVDETDPRKLIHGAIDGMLAQLDPHTSFLPAEEFSAMKADTAGEFGGLGIEIGLEEGELVVVRPLEDSPAERAGILAGDRILAIDGAPTEGMGLSEAVRKMRGPPGSKLPLTIFREGFRKPLEMVLLRDRIQIRSVEARLHEGGVGYVRIKSFQEKTESFVAAALEELRRENGGEELSGLVLDLRSNPGGLLDQAVRVADRFLERGEIVTTKGRGGRTLDIERAHAAGTEANYPMVILVNEGSASASEVVAGALQDHGRAILVGTTTYGKGSVQTVIDLDDGSGLKLTVARYYTPSQRSIHGSGIEPDVVVPKEEAVVLASAAPVGLGEAEEGVKEGSSIDEERDHQLGKALDILATWDRFQAERAAERAQTAQAE